MELGGCAGLGSQSHSGVAPLRSYGALPSVMVQESEQSLFGLINVSHIPTHTVRLHILPQILVLFRPLKKVSGLVFTSIYCSSS